MRRTNARSTLYAGLFLIVILIAMAAYVAVSALQARTNLEHARDTLRIVKDDLIAGKQNEARSRLADADREANAAHNRTTGPLWAIGAHLPFLGGPLDTERGLAAAAETLTAKTLPAVVGITDTLSPDQLRIGPGQIDVARLATAAPTLTSADRQTQKVLRQVDGLPDKTWLSQADAGRTKFLDLATSLEKTLDNAAAAARLLPPMLGQHGTRRYFVVIQNEAEARGLGGLPGTFAILTATNGKLAFSRFGTDRDITGHATPHTGSNAWWDQFGPQKLFIESNVSPDFPTVAKIWLSMWQQQTHQQLDGTIALDPTALSYLLEVTGPASLPDGSQVTGDNIVELSEKTAYERFADNNARKAYLVLVGRATADKVLHATGGTHELADALGHAVTERRLLVWSAHPTEEADLATRKIGGAVPRTTAPFTATVINNAAGSKLDYYLDRSITYVPGGCSGGRRLATVTITLHNGAPASGLPPYVTSRTDNPVPKPPPGTSRLLVTLYTTAGSTLTSMTVDGKPQDAQPGSDQGHPLFSVTGELPPQKSSTIVFTLNEPRIKGPVQTFAQPLSRTAIQDIKQPTC